MTSTGVTPTAQCLGWNANNVSLLITELPQWVSSGLGVSPNRWATARCDWRANLFRMAYLGVPASVSNGTA